MIKINQHIFGSETFNNKEVIYEEVPVQDNINTISLFFESNKDIADLMMAHLYLKNKIASAKQILFLPYIPYSRMDRQINNQIFSLEIFAQLINNMDFEKVICCDPHSEVSSKLINKLEEINFEEHIQKIAEDNKIDVIMFPDKGARKKYTKKFLKLCSKYPIIFGEKCRDLDNKGHLKTLNIISDYDLTNKNILIVDDLCSYGNTFKFASLALKNAGAREVYLWITHCENAIMDGPLLKENHVNKVFTTNSIVKNFENEQISILNIVEGL